MQLGANWEDQFSKGLKRRDLIREQQKEISAAVQRVKDAQHPTEPLLPLDPEPQIEAQPDNFVKLVGDSAAQEKLEQAQQQGIGFDAAQDESFLGTSERSLAEAEARMSLEPSGPADDRRHLQTVQSLFASEINDPGLGGLPCPDPSAASAVNKRRWQDDLATAELQVEAVKYASSQVGGLEEALLLQQDPNHSRSRRLQASEGERQQMEAQTIQWRAVSSASSTTGVPLANSRTCGLNAPLDNTLYKVDMEEMMPWRKSGAPLYAPESARRTKSEIAHENCLELLEEHKQMCMRHKMLVLAMLGLVFTLSIMMLFDMYGPHPEVQ